MVMINTFYDQQGKAVFYIDEDGYSIFLYDGTAVAWKDENDNIYSYSGKHLGWLIDGWIIDHYGDSVYFGDDSIGGPARPGRQGRPGRAGRQGRPGRAGREGNPGKPGRTSKWSRYNNSDFFYQI